MSSDTEMEQAPDLWFFDDGVIVLRAEKRIFRIQKAILAARSPVFRAMFEFPQPATGGDEMMDGNAVVRLHDSPEEVEAFLRAIFDSSYFMPPPAQIDFYAVLGILRLAHKYDVDYLFKRALSHLEMVYPTKLAKVWEIHLNGMGYDTTKLAFDLGALLVLHETEATWLIPYVYYNIATFDSDALPDAGKRWDNLPAEMKRLCAVAHGYQLQATRRINAFLSHPSTCTRRDSCNSCKLECLEAFMTGGSIQGLLPQDPFSEWGSVEWKELKGALCHECFTLARKEYDGILAQIWNELPKNCGMEEGWHVLLEKRRAALK
ncbi:hypothetical protein C8R43DRAFT_1054359 [Mycena crocata]|nr:hypothetical protein C8R43DRAFT_1054359 [Mycena crocata]